MDLHPHFHSAGTQNHFSTSNAQLDEMLDASLAETDRETAIQIVQDAQDLILDNAHFGRIQGHNGITTQLWWNYIHKAAEPGVREEGLTGFTFRHHSLEARSGSWIDESDPTFSGRPDIQPEPI